MRRGVSEYHLQVLFLQLCDHRDSASIGTVRVGLMFEWFRNSYVKLFRRFVRAQAGGRRPRLLFEEAVRLILDICSMDYFTLVVVSARVVSGSDVIDADGVRAMVRYVASDRVDDFTKLVCRLLVCDRGLPHMIPALVDLSVRYPCLFYPVLQLQRALQRRFLGTRFWTEFHRRNHSLLFPPDFTYAGAKAVTARQLILEMVSSEARPFVIGSLATSAIQVPAGGPRGASASEDDDEDEDVVVVHRQPSFMAASGAGVGSPKARLSLALAVANSTIAEESDESESGDAEEWHDATDDAPADTTPSPGGADSVQGPGAETGMVPWQDQTHLALSAPRAALRPTPSFVVGVKAVREQLDARDRAMKRDGKAAPPLGAHERAVAHITDETAKTAVGVLFATAAGGAARKHVRRDVVISLPMPVADASPAFVAANPPPNGIRLKAAPLALARAVLLHFASGAGSYAKRVNAPCLLCGRRVGTVKTSTARSQNRSVTMVLDGTVDGLAAEREAAAAARSGRLGSGGAGASGAAKQPRASGRRARVAEGSLIGPAFVAGGALAFDGTANTGFCADCDEYGARALVDTFGYKVSRAVVKACQVEGSAADAITAATAAAAREKQPLVDTGESFVPFVFADDVYVEQFDDEHGRFFYYNVATGTSTWRRPAAYVPFDFEEKGQAGQTGT